MTALLVAFLLAQHPATSAPPPGGTPKPMTDEQRCQQDCGKKVLECQLPCAPRTPEEADKPEKRKEFLACSQDCAKKQKPCMDACATKTKKKKDGDTKGDGE